LSRATHNKKLKKVALCRDFIETQTIKSHLHATLHARGINMRNSGWQNDSVVNFECANCKTLQVGVDQSKHAKLPIKCEDGDLKMLRIYRFSCRCAEGEAQHASTGHKKRKPALVTWWLEFC
jgi:hypothetical protein